MHRKIIPYLNDIEAVLDGEFRPPVTCEIDPSNRCQNDCDFCMYTAYRNREPVDLNMVLYFGLIHDLRKMGVKSITFTGGGEPTMHPNFKEMVLAAQDFELGLATNGIYLGRFFEILHHFKFIRISLDAATPETYRAMKGADEFEKVISNVRIALKFREKTVIGLSYVISKGNEKEIKEAQKLADDLGVDYIQIKPAYQKYDLDCDISKEERSFILKRYPATGGIACAVAQLVGIVGADGNVYYCCQGRGRKGFKVGRLGEDGGIHEIWEKRLKMKPQCEVKACRYMNYAKGYEKYSTKRNVILRHANFL